MNFKTNSKKLQFGSTKCKKIHVGKYCQDFKCQQLKVHNWEEVEIRNDETGNIDIEDHFAGEEIMEEKNEEKYLGDIIQ
jgi:hypothetical protein